MEGRALGWCRQVLVPAPRPSDAPDHPESVGRLGLELPPDRELDLVHLLPSEPLGLPEARDSIPPSIRRDSPTGIYRLLAGRFTRFSEVSEFNQVLAGLSGVQEPEVDGFDQGMVI